MSNKVQCRVKNEANFVKTHSIKSTGSASRRLRRIEKRKITKQ